MAKPKPKQTAPRRLLRAWLREAMGRHLDKPALVEREAYGRTDDTLIRALATELLEPGEKASKKVSTSIYRQQTRAYDSAIELVVDLLASVTLRDLGEIAAQAQRKRKRTKSKAKAKAKPAAKPAAKPKTKAAKAPAKPKAPPRKATKAKPAAKRRTAAQITEEVRELLGSTGILNNPGGFPKAEVRERLKISGAVAKRVLDNLLMAGAIVVVGEGRKARFRMLASKQAELPAQEVADAQYPGAA